MQDNFKLIIGNKNHSSWSLRAYLAVKHSGINYEEIVIPIYLKDSREKIAKYSPSGKVPVLIHNDVAIWDSYAICQYLMDLKPDLYWLPKGNKAKALALSMSAEMHSSFMAMRTELKMNMQAKTQVNISDLAKKDVARVLALWEEAISNYGGEFLFGKFSLGDIMYAPVVSRFKTYNIQVSPTIQKYMDNIWSHPFMKDWIKDALKEPWIIDWEQVKEKGYYE